MPEPLPLGVAHHSVAIFPTVDVDCGDVAVRALRRFQDRAPGNKESSSAIHVGDGERGALFARHGAVGQWQGARSGSAVELELIQEVLSLGDAAIGADPSDAIDHAIVEDGRGENAPVVVDQPGIDRSGANNRDPEDALPEDVSRVGIESVHGIRHRGADAEIVSAAVGQRDDGHEEGLPFHTELVAGRLHREKLLEAAADDRGREEGLVEIGAVAEIAAGTSGDCLERARGGRRRGGLGQVRSGSVDARHLHAMFVGIDRFASGLGAKTGCRHDRKKLFTSHIRSFANRPSPYR